MRPALDQDHTLRSDRRRTRIGFTGIAVGLVMLAAGVIVAHFTALPAEDSVGRSLYPHIPRCLPFENPGSCWLIPTAGQVIGLVGSQVLLAAVAYAWILGRPLTWARASVAAFLFTVEMIILFGVVPNEWLALTQGTFEWTAQKTALTVPRWLVLNNEVTISYAVIKDLVSGGYSATLLIALAVGAYQLQERAKRAGSAPTPPARVSSYGRTLVEGRR